MKSFYITMMNYNQSIDGRRVQSKLINHFTETYLQAPLNLRHVRGFIYYAYLYLQLERKCFGFL